jgi:hypothetical protein
MLQCYFVCFRTQVNRTKANQPPSSLGTALLLLVLLFASLQSGAQAQTGYIKESFEGSFPPTGWQIRNVLGSNQWVKSTNQAHTGSASAYIQYQTANAEDWLILPHFSVEKSTDSIMFWVRLAFQGYSPDRLEVLLSTTDDALTSFTTTLLDLQEGVNYPPNSNTWYQHKVSLENFVNQDIYIAFKHTNNNGDGLYIDDVELGTPPAADVAVVSIDAPLYATSAGAIPKVTVKNEGSEVQTFTLQLTATDGYTSSVSVVDLAPQATRQVSLSTWTPAAGTYTFTATAVLQEDEIQDNNIITKSISAYNEFPHQGWVTKTALPAPRWANGLASLSNLAGNEASLYAISGADANFNNTTSVERFDAASNTWTPMAPIPAARLQISANTIGNKIYVAGGYTSTFSPTNRLDIYDIATNSWAIGENMPTAVGDYASAVLGDSLLYIIGGYNGSLDVNLVQIYNTNTNTWLVGTAKAGTAAAGLRGGIANGKVVVAGGYNQSAGSLSEAWLGTINSEDPTQITWTALPVMPGGPSSRLGAGVGAFLNRIYFTAGDPNGQGNQVLATTIAYNVTTNEWEIGPSKPTGVSNISNFTPVVFDKHSYMASVGGYNGSAVVGINEWLDLGPIPGSTASVLSANGATTICRGTQANLVVNVTGGTSPYTVVYSDGTNNITVNDYVSGANIPVFPTATTTYSLVSVTDANGAAGSGNSGTQTITVTNPPTWYVDADGDKYSGSTTEACTRPTNGFFLSELQGTGDCNDGSAAVNPSAAEICANGIDDNCNGQTDENCGPCKNAVSFSTAPITATSATLNWVASVKPVQWQIQYKTTANGSQWVDVFVAGSARSVTITGLKTKQSYNWHIRAKCGTTWTAYSGSISFKTGAISRTTANAVVVNEKADMLSEEADGLQVSVLNNPSSSYFTLILRSSSDKVASLRIVDAVGRTVEGRSGLSANSTQRIGHNYISGLYYVQVMQGNRKVTLKLVKQPN